MVISIVIGSKTSFFLIPIIRKDIINNVKLPSVFPLRPGQLSCVGQTRVRL
jgi:hypothetical protein